MKKKIHNKFLLLLSLFFATINNIVFGQTMTNGQNIPTPPMQTESDGFGAPASPIDMYVVILVIIAIGFAVYFAKNYSKQLSK